MVYEMHIQYTVVTAGNTAAVGVNVRLVLTRGHHVPQQIDACSISDVTAQCSLRSTLDRALCVCVMRV